MKSSKWIGMALAGCLMLGGTAQAGVDEEFAFASGLVSFSPSFPDFAQKVVDAVLAKDPTQKDRSKIIQAEILIQRRQFADAEALIAEMGLANPKSQAISLALARNYFGIGELDKSRALYEAFFKQYEQMPTDPDVARFYRDAAYQFAQMQMMAGNYEGAAASYQRVEAVADGSEMKRSLQVSRAQALVKAAEQKSGDEKTKLLDAAKKVCETLQWGGLDLQFVDSIVILANIELAKGNPAGAQKVLMDYMDIIKPIDDTLAQLGLPMRDSPMAGARSLLGRLKKEAADKLAGENKANEAIQAYSGALGEYYNVFVKYGDSEWGPSAGMAAKEIKAILETKYGKTVKIDLPDSLASKAAGTEFMMADNLFRQKKHAEAAAEYLRVLAQFPEATDLSVGALGNLVQCYMNLNDDLYAKMVANYLGERFAAKSDVPAKALISVAQLYDKAGHAEMSKYMFDRYLAYCPADPRAGQILFYLAAKAEQAAQQAEKDGKPAEQEQKQAEANAYLAKIITDYQNDQNYPKALSKRAWKAYLDKDYAGAVDGMKLYIEQSQPSPTRAQAMFALGDCFRRTDRMADAVRQFNALVAALAPAGNPYGSSAADLERNAKLLEQARFYFAYSLSRLPAEATRKAAIAKIDEFLGFYPKSDLAAKALNLKGSLQMALKDPAANETFARLAREYPETDEGKNAQYARINGALDLGQFDQAREALASMLANPGSYSVDEFARVGQAMLDKGQWQDAADSFGRVAGQTEERALLERALYGTGAAKYELGDHAGAVAALDELMVKWPNSALFYQAKFMLARANMALNDLAAAKTALNDVFKFAREPEVVNDAKLLYGQILQQQGDQTGALGAYKGLEYFGSQAMKTEKERQQVEQAILAAIDLAADMDKHADVLESCDLYLKLYPTSPRVGDVRQKRTAASFKVNADVAPAPAAAPAAPAAPSMLE
ncbi:MAG: tetratricopeptide repeat protein [Kiritimatiellia bacterium]